MNEVNVCIAKENHGKNMYMHAGPKDEKCRL